MYVSLYLIHIGGVSIKLRMGKDENKLAEQSSDENKTPATETFDKKTDLEKNEDKNPKNSNVSNPKTVEKVEDKKKNADDLRRVIKLGPKDDEKSQKQEEKKEKDLKQNEPIEDDSEITTRESLEQKRAILQSIKDFDFQIKKNSEDINSLNQKLESITKDLDDLVSLYEIVSEQMNPFVGLSKVTKKRIEALENFTKEIEDLKNRIADIESSAEKTGVNLENIKLQRRESSNNNTDKNTADILPKDLSESDLDNIIEKSLDELSLDKEIDIEIENFIEGLLEKDIN